MHIEISNLPWPPARSFGNLAYHACHCAVFGQKQRRDFGNGVESRPIDLTIKKAGSGSTPKTSLAVRVSPPNVSGALYDRVPAALPTPSIVANGSGALYDRVPAALPTPSIVANVSGALYDRVPAALPRAPIVANVPWLCKELNSHTHLSMGGGWGMMRSAPHPQLHILLHGGGDEVSTAPSTAHTSPNVFAILLKREFT
jgi:hypothetical protein